MYEKNGEIKGFISLTKNHINGLFVLVDAQRQGIGSALIKHAKERHSSLELVCFVDNYQAQRFYHSLGFEVVLEQNNAELPFDEYLMRWARWATTVSVSLR